MAPVSLDHLFPNIPTNTTTSLGPEDLKKLKLSQKLSQKLLRSYQPEHSFLFRLFRGKPIEITGEVPSLQKRTEGLAQKYLGSKHEKTVDHSHDIPAVHALVGLKADLLDINKCKTPEEYFGKVSAFMRTCQLHNFDPKRVGLKLDKELFTKGAEATFKTYSKPSSDLNTKEFNELATCFEHLDGYLAACKSFGMKPEEFPFTTASALFPAMQAKIDSIEKPGHGFDYCIQRAGIKELTRIPNFNIKLSKSLQAKFPTFITKSFALYEAHDIKYHLGSQANSLGVPIELGLLITNGLYQNGVPKDPLSFVMDCVRIYQEAYPDTIIDLSKLLESTAFGIEDHLKQVKVNTASFTRTSDKQAKIEILSKAITDHQKLATAIKDIPENVAGLERIKGALANSEEAIALALKPFQQSYNEALSLKEATSKEPTTLAEFHALQGQLEGLEALKGELASWSERLPPFSVKGLQLLPNLKRLIRTLKTYVDSDPLVTYNEFGARFSRIEETLGQVKANAQTLKRGTFDNTEARIEFLSKAIQDHDKLTADSQSIPGDLSIHKALKASAEAINSALAPFQTRYKAILSNMVLYEHKESPTVQDVFALEAQLKALQDVKKEIALWGEPKNPESFGVLISELKEETEAELLIAHEKVVSDSKRILVEKRKGAREELKARIEELRTTSIAYSFAKTSTAYIKAIAPLIQDCVNKSNTAIIGELYAVFPTETSFNKQAAESLLKKPNPFAFAEDTALKTAWENSMAHLEKLVKLPNLESVSTKSSKTTEIDAQEHTARAREIKANIEAWVRLSIDIFLLENPKTSDEEIIERLKTEFGSGNAKTNETIEANAKVYLAGLRT